MVHNSNSPLNPKPYTLNPEPSRIDWGLLPVNNMCGAESGALLGQRFFASGLDEI